MEKTTKITIETQLVIIDQKLALYRNSLYDAQLDGRIAQHLDNAQQIAAATNRMKEIHKTIDWLVEERKKIESGVLSTEEAD